MVITFQSRTSESKTELAALVQACHYNVGLELDRSDHKSRRNAAPKIMNFDFDILVQVTVFDAAFLQDVSSDRSNPSLTL